MTDYENPGPVEQNWRDAISSVEEIIEDPPMSPRTWPKTRRLRQKTSPRMPFAFKCSGFGPAVGLGQQRLAKNIFFFMLFFQSMVMGPATGL